MLAKRGFVAGALIGALCGTFGVEPVVAQTAPPAAYLVINTEQFQSDQGFYYKMVEATVTRFNGKILTQNAIPVGVDASELPTSTVTLIGFANMADLKAWWDSPFFQGLLKANEKTSKIHSFAIEGRPPS
jgi:uncharacterized protein (DUF1330 family)